MYIIIVCIYIYIASEICKPICTCGSWRAGAYIPSGRSFFLRPQEAIDGCLASSFFFSGGTSFGETEDFRSEKTAFLTIFGKPIFWVWHNRYFKILGNNVRGFHTIFTHQLRLARNTLPQYFQKHRQDVSSWEAMKKGCLLVVSPSFFDE